MLFAFQLMARVGKTLFEDGYSSWLGSREAIYENEVSLFLNFFTSYVYPKQYYDKAKFQVLCINFKKP